MSRRCDGKIPYHSGKKASIAAKNASHKTGDLIISYQCWDCGMFHIGHAPREQKLVRGLSE